MFKQKSLSFGTSAESSVKVLTDFTIASSPLLSAIGTLTLATKYTHVPYVDIPAKDATEYRIGGLSTEKKMFNVSATITDETLEDSSMELKEPLKNTIATQARIKLENLVLTKLRTDIVETELLDNSDATSTILKLLEEFDPALHAANTPIVVGIAYTTYYQLLVSATSNAFVKAGLIKLAPSSGVAADEVIMVHPLGSAVGFDLSALEIERNAGKGSQTINAQGTYGASFAPTYVKRATF